jgi:hypothetical protein
LSIVALYYDQTDFIFMFLMKMNIYELKLKLIFVETKNQKKHNTAMIMNLKMYYTIITMMRNDEKIIEITMNSQLFKEFNFESFQQKSLSFFSFHFLFFFIFSALNKY